MKNKTRNLLSLSPSELFKVVSDLYSKRCKTIEEMGINYPTLAVTAEGKIIGEPKEEGSHIYDVDGKPFYLLAGVHIILDLINFEWIS